VKSKKVTGTSPRLKRRGEVTNQVDTAISRLKSVGIALKSEGTNIVFVIPKHLEESLAKVYGFSTDELKVGADIPLAELARHMDEQAAMEERAGVVAETLRHVLNQAELDFEMWFNTIFWKCKNRLDLKMSDKSVTSYVISKYGKTYRKYKERINRAEYTYRLMNNAIRAAWQTKGKLLPSLRNIVQGDKPIGGIEVRTTGTRIET